MNLLTACCLKHQVNQCLLHQFVAARKPHTGRGRIRRFFRVPVLQPSYASSPETYEDLNVHGHRRPNKNQTASSDVGNREGYSDSRIEVAKLPRRSDLERIQPMGAANQPCAENEGGQAGADK
jgi:hypothetical protein